MYTKVYADIIHSSLWSQDAETKVVWMTMLVMSDRDGFVNTTAPGIARAAGVALERTREILAYLAGPDPDSRTPDHEGRRIEAVDGGFLILNHAKYRNLRTERERRDGNRERQSRWRERHGGITRRNANVTRNNALSHGSCQIADPDPDPDPDLKEREKRGKGGDSGGLRPLGSLLLKEYPGLWESLKARCPVKVPADGTKADREARETLAALVEQDGFAEQEVIDALRWVFTSDHVDAAFWRKSTKSLGPALRKRMKTGSTRFADIHAAWTAAKDGERGGVMTEAEAEARLKAMGAA